MSMTVHSAPQGSIEWLAERAGRFNAGDAAAMLGCDVNGRTRTDLLDELATGLTPEASAFKQRLYDKGHQVEALMRPLAQELIGEDLYPLVGSIAVDGLSRRLGSSFDGTTICRDTNFEAKSLNQTLAAALPVEDDPDANDAANLPKGYRVQLEQQQMVNGATRTLFGAGEFHPDDSTKSQRWCWYTSDPALRAEILAGWAQFDADLSAHIPTVIAEMPKAEVTVALPALFIHAKGEITTSNMKEYGVALAARLEQIRSIQLLTDQDFSNAKESAKLLRENIESAKLAKEAMLAQTVTVGEAARMIDAWCEDMRLTALQLEKDVEREDKAKKAAMIDAAKVKYAAHVADLDRELVPARVTLAAPIFAEAIKNKRNFASMQDALDTMLAAAKIGANDQAATIRFNREQLRPQNGVAGDDWITLFPDFAAVCTKSREDFHNLVTARVADHRQRMEAERERIRKEEADKLQREQEARDREVARIATLAEAEAAKPAPTPAPAAIAAPAPVSQAPKVVPMGTRAPAAEPATLKLGEINARLGFTMTAEFVATSLGITGQRERGAVLFKASDYDRIRAALVQHIEHADHAVAA